MILFRVQTSRQPIWPELNQCRAPCRAKSEPDSRASLPAILLVALSVVFGSAQSAEFSHPEGPGFRRGAEEKKRDDEVKRDDALAKAREPWRGRDLTNAPKAEPADASRLLRDIESARNNTNAQAALNRKIFYDSNKIGRQINERGWTPEEVERLTKTEATGNTVDNTNGRGDSASVYGEQGKYIVVNDRLSEIIALSDKNDPNWKDDSRIEWKANK